MAPAASPSEIMPPTRYELLDPVLPEAGSEAMLRLIRDLRKRDRLGAEVPDEPTLVFTIIEAYIRYPAPVTDARVS
jgi:hypothetical protein